MGAAEVIAKAIEKLERLKTSSTPGPWVVEEIEHQAGVGVFVAAHREYWDQYARALIDNGMDAVENASLQKGDAELIVALHRTIDAQLVILKDARRTLLYASLPGTVVGVFAESAVHNAVALAAAILGES